MSHYRLLVNLAQPYTLLVLLAALAAVLLWWRRKESRKRLLLILLPLAALVTISIPWVSYHLLHALELPYPHIVERPPQVQALVVLAAGVRLPDLVRRRPELDQDSLYRCLHAHELYRQGKPIPLFLVGGKADEELGDPPCADLMADFLRQRGVPESDLIVENRSRTTYENAVEAARMLEERGLTRVGLVTDAAHMARAAGCFRKQGIEVVPLAANHQATRLDDTFFVYLPSSSALRQSERVWHEWLGILWYRWHGRM